MDDGFKEYVAEYGFDGKRWGLTIPARSWEEAESRLKAIGAWGQVQGELQARIPAVPGAGLFVRLWVWLSNLRRPS